MTKTDLSELNIKFEKVSPKAREISIGGTKVYVSEDLRWIGKNPFFIENHDKETILVDPLNPLLAAKVDTKEVAKNLSINLNFWFWELKKIIEVESNTGSH